MTEVWKPVVGFEGLYEISTIGRCRRIRSAYGIARIRVLRPGSNRGYAYYVLVDRKVKKYLRPHRAVYETFVGKITEGMQINHKNGVKSDNRLANLEVVTASENKLHAIHVLGKKPYMIPSQGELNGRAKLTEADVAEAFSLRKGGWSQQEIAQCFHVNQTTISRILLNQTWKNSNIIK